MLLYTGPLKGDFVTEKIVSATDLQKQYNIELPTNRSVEFEKDESQKSYDPVNKVYRAGKSLQYEPVFTAMTKDGQQIELRIYQSFANRKLSGGGSEKIYFPARNAFEGTNMLVNGVKDKELAVFMALSPMCGTSPLRKEGDTKRWNLVDREAESKKELAKEMSLIRLQGKVMAASFDTITNKAYGIRIQNEHGSLETVPNVAASDISTLQAALLRLCKKYPEEFGRQWDSMDADLFGIIQRAVDAGIIKQRTVSGNIIWSWRPGVNDGLDIMTAGRNTDAMTALVSFYANGDDFPEAAKIISANMSPTLSAAQEGMMRSVLFGKNVADMTPMELIEFGEKSQTQGPALFFNVMDGKLYLVDDTLQATSPDPIFEATNKLVWREEFAVKLEDKKLKNALLRHFNTKK